MFHLFCDIIFITISVIYYRLSRSRYKIIITRSQGHVVESGRHSGLPPGNGDEQFVSPHLQAQWQIVLLYVLATGNGRLPGLLVGERKVQLLPAKHLPQAVIYRPHGACATPQNQYR